MTFPDSRSPTPDPRSRLPRPLQVAVCLVAVLLLATFFAQVEIQIEGGQGWAAGLPTWRIEEHWLLDLFWGGRPMTGYHAWVFPFIALVFHFPAAFGARWSWRLEARALSCIMLFWLVEDWLWFVMNPAFGLAKFTPAHIPWHKHWLLGVPVDYLVFTVVGGFLMWFSFSTWRPWRRLAKPEVAA